MSLDTDTVQKLLDELTRDRAVYLENASKTHALLHALINSHNAAKSPVVEAHHGKRRRSNSFKAALTRAALRDTTADLEVESLPFPRSTFSNDSDSLSDANESMFVQTPLEREEYSMDGFRQHVMTHKWTACGQEIIANLHLDQDFLSRACLLPLNDYEASEDRSRLTHYSIFDVGADGSPLDILSADPKPPTRALEIWNRIRSTNTDPDKSRPTVGRIIIVREPSPALFAGLHYILNKHIDMDELFDLLHNDDPGLSYPHRAFATDPRHSRTFVISFEYFTVIGDHCIPSPWQRFDKGDGNQADHIPISRCSSCVVLALEAPHPMTHVRNRDRRIDKKFGDVFDPFAPYRVVALMSYPDWNSTTDTHKPTNHYVNGPEAFLVTVEAEFNDARKRLKEVYNCVSELVEPPPNFIFDEEIRNKMLFEDDTFTYSKRYFWAYQTLSIVNQDITEMIESYRETFKDSVWEGSNKIIWPGESSASSRYQQWRKRMAKVRKEIDFEVHKLEEIRALNEKKMKDIEALRENLFCGTSVRESRSSVEQTKITIAQNRSIMLLTLVTLVFLPLTFVTGVYGMTNMNPDEGFVYFGITTACVCVPTYMFVGSLYSDKGRGWWSHRWQDVSTSVARVVESFLVHAKLKRRLIEQDARLPARSRTLSVTQADRMRETQATDPHLLVHTLSRASSRQGTAAVPRPYATSGDAHFLVKAGPEDRVPAVKSPTARFSPVESPRMPKSVATAQSVSSEAAAFTAEKAAVDDDRGSVKSSVSAQRLMSGPLARMWSRRRAKSGRRGGAAGDA